LKKIICFALILIFFNISILFSQTAEMSSEYLMIEALMNPTLSPLTYTLGPGDRISLNLWGNVNANYTITVARDGTIFIPRKSKVAQPQVQGYVGTSITETVPSLGQIKVVGLTIEELKEMIEERVKKYFRGVNIRVTLSGLRVFPTPVLGNVVSPGVYSITPLYRLSHLIKRAGGILGTGSYRNIMIKKPDGSSKVYDLYQFLYKGNMEQNPYIKTGDIVIIPQAFMTVKIIGSVCKRGNFELKKGERLKDLIEFARGFQSGGSLTKAIKIYNIKTPDEILEIDPYKLLIENDSLSNIELRTGDVVTIPREPFTVTVIGQVRLGGSFEYEAGADFYYYLGLAGGYGERANEGNVHITRWDGTRLKWKKGVEIKPGDTIVIGRLELKGWKDYLEVTLNAANLIFIIWTTTACK